MRDAIAAGADEDEIMEAATGAGAIAVDYEDGLMVTVGDTDHVESYAVVAR